jgi:TM2 domain-containing membrane protein YozV
MTEPNGNDREPDPTAGDATASPPNLGPEWDSSWPGGVGPVYGAPGTGPEWQGSEYPQPGYQPPSYVDPATPNSGYQQADYPPPSYPPPSYPPPGYGSYPAASAYAYGSPDAPYGRHPITGEPFSDKQKVTAGVLQIFLGAFGAGRFYLNQPGMAIAQIAVTWLTCGLGGIWPLIDGILMLTGNVRDKFGRPLRD